jgi:RNA polymerase sigma factor (sigma-70 family)
MNDWQLVSAYVQGDEHAFESLLKKYFPMVYSAALRQVNDRNLAEEIAQSVFILFARKAARLSPRVLLTGWFLRTTRFVARDARKQMNRRQKREQRAAEWAALDKEGDPAWQVLAPWVDEALLALSVQEQACVVSRFILGRSFRDIGQELRIPEDTAQKRVSRSLDKMRLFLQRRGLRIAATSIAGLLSVDLSRAAGPYLIEAALGAIKAASAGKSALGGSAALADAVGRALAWRAAAKLGLSITAGIILLGAGGFAGWARWEPPVPANAPFQLTDARIDALGVAWSRVTVNVARLIYSFPQGPPQAGNPRALIYQREVGVIEQESNRILAELTAVLANRSRPIQYTMLAEMITVELRENLGLSRRQQAAVFGLLKNQLAPAVEGQGGAASTLRNRLALAATIRSWLSPRQRQRFEYVYGTDYRGLFALLLHVER